MSKSLITEETRKSYLNRLKKLQEYKFSEKGDELFVTKLIVESEQINNLHVKARINDLEIDNDALEEMGGNRTAPTPLESLISSFANCLEISALLYFSFSKLKINSLKVKVEATYDKRYDLPDERAPLLGLYDIKYTWYIDTLEPLEKIEKVLKKVEKYCPVKGTFSRTHKYQQEIVLINR